MDMEVIKSYLVSLGFEVRQPELNKFTEALKLAGREAERAAGGMAGTFVKAGAAIVGVLTSIAAGTVGVMEHTAQADLGYQLFARRMFMSTDAAKKLKIATDALGYSLEEIVWGPPELGERYHALIKDQDKMLKNLGGADFEKQMKNIRNIRFEFTRLGVEISYLGMQLTKSIMDKLFGGPEALDRKLERFNIWFQDNIPKMADTLANVLAPGFQKIGMALEAIFTKKNVEWAVNVAVKGAENIALLLEWLKNKDKLGLLFGETGTAIGNGILFSSPTSSAQKRAWWSGDPNWKNAKNTQGDLERMAGDIATAHGIDPALFKAIIKRESGWNVGARNSGSGAFGLGQLMPGNMNAFGMSGDTPEGNMEIAARLLEQYLRDSRGNEALALRSYNGVKTSKGEKSFEPYYEDIQRYRREYSGGASYRPQAYHPSIDVGGITVNVTQPNASAEEIAHAVSRSVSERLDKQTQRIISNHQGAYA